MDPFTKGALLFGVVCAIGALLSGLTRRSFLSLTVVFVGAGILAGPELLGLLELSRESSLAHDVALAALIVILFNDALEVDEEMLGSAWHLPARKLVIAMPLTAIGTAAAAHWIIGLDWTLSFLLGALIAPTDPVLSSAVASDPRVPRRVRHTLNLESGLNDGLAIPAILAFTAAAGAAGEEHFVWYEFLAQDLGLGVLIGLGAGTLAAGALPRDGKHDLPPHALSLFALGVAFATYAASYGAHGNGFVAVFCCATVLGIRRRDLRHVVEDRAADVSEILKLAVFLVFGASLTLSMFTWEAIVVAALLFAVIRPVAVLASSWRTELTLVERLFVGWFGPRGVATMAFGLVVLSLGPPGGGDVVDVASVVVFCSIIAHGFTDTLGASWIGRRTTEPPGEDDDDQRTNSARLATM